MSKCPFTYLCSLFGQVKRDPLADFRGQLTEHLSLETTYHDLAESPVQLIQVGCTTTVPLPVSPKEPVRVNEELSCSWRCIFYTFHA